jgi:hypothetical protein
MTIFWEGSLCSPLQIHIGDHLPKYMASYPSRRCENQIHILFFLLKLIEIIIYVTFTALVLQSLLLFTLMLRVDCNRNKATTALSEQRNLNFDLK